ncbi:hypothetical protein FHG87_008825 [Trinorchestia longiramus]|nr:hypothetical protein FHG87_008825 [Trinorchestia longiramus]
MFAKLLVLLFVVAMTFAMPSPDDDDDSYYFVRSFSPVQFRSYIPSVRTYSAPVFSGVRRSFGYYDFDD